jgi:hypothetical protein
MSNVVWRMAYVAYGDCHYIRCTALHFASRGGQLLTFSHKQASNQVIKQSPFHFRRERERYILYIYYIIYTIYTFIEQHYIKKKKREKETILLVEQIKKNE